MEKYVVIAFGLLLWACSASAQQPQPPAVTPQAAVPKSPEVLADSRVTFRLLAPAAVAVTLGGDHPIGNTVAMTKDSQGVWSVTVGPLKADFYSYFFTVDGVRTLDFRNATVMRDGVRYASWLRVPGPDAADYQVNDVPHGTVAQVGTHRRRSAQRRMTVYTPPGYETGTERYPVLYLLHGGGNDELGWIELGGAAEILDNLLAKRRVRPMIVVMPNGNATLAAAPNFVPPSGPMGPPG